MSSAAGRLADAESCYQVDHGSQDDGAGPGHRQPRSAESSSPKRCSAYLDPAGPPSRRSPYKTCPIIVGIVVLAAAFIVLANILVHIVYAALDPRVRVH